MSEGVWIAIYKVTWVSRIRRTSIILTLFGFALVEDIRLPRYGIEMVACRDIGYSASSELLDSIPMGLAIPAPSEAGLLMSSCFYGDEIIVFLSQQILRTRQNLGGTGFA